MSCWPRRTWLHPSPGLPSSRTRPTRTVCLHSRICGPRIGSNGSIGSPFPDSHRSDAPLYPKRPASGRLNTSTEETNEAMTPRKRWLAILAGKPTDRIPVDLTATPEVMTRLLKELDCADERELWRTLHVDGRIEVAPRWKFTHHPDDPQADLWGVRYQRMEYGTGHYEEPSHH